MRRHAAIIIGAAALCIALGFSAFVYIWAEKRAALFEIQADTGGPFTLVDHTGKTVTDRDFAGRPMVIAFGFTHCPDICPTTLLHMAQWIETLGSRAGETRFVFVTVDPERDDADIMAAYVGAFHDRIVGLTGTPVAIAAMARDYRVYVAKTGDGDDYLVDHSTSTYVIDADGRLSALISYNEPIESAVEKIARLVDSG